MADRVAGCTKTATGFYRWYKGKTRYVAPSAATADEVMRRWVDLQREIDGLKVNPDDVTYREALSLFLAHLDHRVTHGRPKRLSDRSRQNYAQVLNNFGKFVNGSTLLKEITPSDFSRYGRELATHRAATYNTVQALVAGFFNWCVEMQYLDRYTPGPGFQRLSKQDVRDERVATAKSFDVTEAKSILAASSGTFGQMIHLSLACALTGAEAANLVWSTIDIDRRLIDFTRRKTGRIRRLCPIPAAVELPAKGVEELVFRTEGGGNYSACQTTVSRLFRKVMDRAGLTLGEGRNFSSLRTTFYNLCPVTYELERDIIVGHARPGIGWDHYMERFDVERLRYVSDHVWAQLSTSPTDVVVSS